MCSISSVRAVSEDKQHDGWTHYLIAVADLSPSAQLLSDQLVTPTQTISNTGSLLTALYLLNETMCQNVWNLLFGHMQNSKIRKPKNSIDKHVKIVLHKLMSLTEHTCLSPDQSLLCSDHLVHSCQR